METAIAAAKDRLAYYQTTRFVSNYNEAAMVALDVALRCLRDRTEDRAARGVEGSHET